MHSLTELEAVVLGLLWRLGGATAYAVRSHLASSPAARFSASAGAIYPLVRRLARRKLVSGRRTRTGDRGATVWECSPAGRAELRAWLDVPSSSAELVTADPLRTRIIFLGFLPKSARARWLDRAEDALRAHRDHIARLLAEEGGDPWLALAHRNALLQADARLVWIREARAALAAER
jgi:DNA-binding PadR family transcriptional regulator